MQLRSDMTETTPDLTTETTPDLTTETRPAFRDPVIRQADEQARLYLYGEEHGQRVTREQKEVIESIAATDYDGRTVIELLQNGHDAHPRNRHDGAWEVVLHEDEGEHGVLYVANAGNPVNHDDFESICSRGLSNKRPDEGIGNKGVGFKSVFSSLTPHLCVGAVAPENRSCRADGKRRLALGRGFAERCGGRRQEAAEPSQEADVPRAREQRQRDLGANARAATQRVSAWRRG